MRSLAGVGALVCATWEGASQLVRWFTRAAPSPEYCDNARCTLLPDHHGKCVEHVRGSASPACTSDASPVDPAATPPGGTASSS